MLDCVCPYFCCSKHPGGGIPVSEMDDLDFQGIDAVWNSGNRIRCWLAIDISEE
jgi:hypothetical protein